MTATTSRILVVDDDASNRNLLTRQLLKRGYTVEAVSSGPAALAFLATQPANMVLLDWQMPDMSGIEVLRSIRQTYPSSTLPVLMVTAKNDSADIVSALELGADDYISKPIDFAVAFARIKTHLARGLVESQLRESDERYALTAKGANVGLWDWKLAANEIYLSPRWKEIAGCGEDEIGSRPEEWFDRVHPMDLPHVRQDLDDHLAGRTPYFQSEHRLRHKEGGFRWVLMRGRAVRNAVGVATRIVGSETDITEGKVVDALTGLPNRLLLVDRLDRLIQHHAFRRDADFALLLLDLDEFKVVNDSLGHQIGDQLLHAVARRLEASLRSTDLLSRPTHGSNRAAHGLEHTLARFGGDEFIILLNDVADPTDATHIAKRLQLELARPFRLAERDLFVGASIGIAVSATGYTTTEDLLRDADIAMNRAKALGKGRSEVFDIAMGERAVERLRLDSELRMAITRHEFLPYFQPIVDMRTGQLAGFEALLRWRHPERGILPPGGFVPLIEKNGLILPIGKRFYEDVCQQYRQWLDVHAGTSSLSINVNFATAQFQEAGLVGRLMDSLGQAGLDPQHIVIEITERTAMRHFSKTADVLLQLREAGFRVVLDDFGSGYSSLACLHKLPITGLKLDRSFIGALDQHEVLISAVLMLSRSLGLTVTAEGIETTEQCERLRALGCDFGQGYLFSRPLDAENAAEMIEAACIFQPTLPVADPQRS